VTIVLQALSSFFSSSKNIQSSYASWVVRCCDHVLQGHGQRRLTSTTICKPSTASACVIPYVSALHFALHLVMHSALYDHYHASSSQWSNLPPLHPHSIAPQPVTGHHTVLHGVFRYSQHHHTASHSPVACRRLPHCVARRGVGFGNNPCNP
jgi:hypothetical protein